MLIQQGIGRSIRIDIRLASLLAGVAGAVNAAGFHSVGLFSANMTGNASALSDHIASGRLGLAVVFGSLILAFILGAFVAAVAVELGRRRDIRAVYAYVVAGEGGALMLLGLGDLIWPGLHGAIPLVAALSFLMGLQNAATTRISNARVRTTHVSGMVTDLGIELALLSGWAHADVDRAEIRARLALHAVSVLAFIAGGVAGVLIYAASGGWLLVGIGLLLLVLTWPNARRRSRASR